jgi:hypothetical protein
MTFDVTSNQILNVLASSDVEHRLHIIKSFLDRPSVTNNKTIIHINDEKDFLIFVNTL